MNKLVTKALLVSATLGLASASADTAVYITGSTAFRSLVFSAIQAVFDGGTPAAKPGSATGAAGSNNSFTFYGHSTALGITGQNLIVYCAFSGSAEGVGALIPGSTFPASSVLNPYINTDGTTNNAAPAVPDFAFSDVYQDSTIFSSDATGVTLPEITDGTHQGIGVIPFGWMRSPGAGTSVTNITAQIAKQLFGAGRIKLKAFSGQDADTSYVYLTGRYSLSGTRAIAQADPGWGSTAGATLYTLTSANALSSTWGSSGYGVGVADTIITDDGGFNSGGNVVKFLNAASPFDAGSVGYTAGSHYYGAGSAFAFVSYAGWPDIGTGANYTAQTLTYNGVPLTKNNIQEGLYSFWSFEHLYASGAFDITSTSTDLRAVFINGTSTPANPFTSNGLIKQLETQISASATAVSTLSMKATRNADGGNIVPQ
jgi:hypothetical protein